MWDSSGMVRYYTSLFSYYCLKIILQNLVSCVAVIAVRNEALHIRRALTSFFEQGIDAVVIDHGSTDGTREICKEYLGHGLITIKDLPWRGVFNLSEQLEVKSSIIKGLPHEWVIHADADEWLLSPVKGETLREGITGADRAGYNAINFEEFVFLPGPEQGNDLSEYNKRYLYYYYFAPQKVRLMRAWKAGNEFSNIDTGGHMLGGNDIYISPETFILRHYIVLSQEHAVNKYLNRRFSDTDLKKGWHNNRLQLDENKLKLPETRYLKKLRSWDDANYDRTDPKEKHYWEW